MVPLSILDLSLILEGGSAGDALSRSGDLAVEAERLGFARYWVAEHHAMPGIASAATSVVMGYLASRTGRIRIGAGGIMLPNHAPLLIAEQFGTLAALYPGRIDLGLGRAPGSDPATSRALRRPADTGERFPEDVLELLAWFETPVPGQSVVATPGAGADIPVWLLGSSLYSAQLAAALGLPFAFASHFAPAMMEEAIGLYRARFRPSARLTRPHVMLSVNIVAAETTAEARILETSLLQYFVALRQGRPRAFPPPVDPETLGWGATEHAVIDSALAMRIVGDATTIGSGLDALVARHAPDELLLAVPIHDSSARLRSLSIIRDVAPVATAHALSV